MTTHLEPTMLETCKKVKVSKWYVDSDGETISNA
jgi:hypothetical protein